MAETRTYGGYTYERQADGSWKRAGAAQPQMPADPTFPYQGAQAQAQAQNTGAQAQVNQATIPAQITQAQAQATSATRTAQTAGLPEGFMWGPDGQTAVPIPGYTRQGLSPEVRAKALAQWQAAQTLDRTIAELERLYDVGPGSTHGFQGLQDFLPTTINQRFDRAANAARGTVRTTLGLTGGEANTLGEAQTNLGAYIPQASDRDATIEDSLARMRSLSQQARGAATATLGGVPDINGNITPIPQQPQFNAMNMPRLIGSGNGTDGLAGSGATTQAVPLPDEMQMENAAWLAQNLATAGPGDYVAFRQNLDRKYGFDSASDADLAAWFTGAQAKVHGGGGTVNPTLPAAEQPMTAREQAGNSFAQNPLGQFLLGAADTGSFGGVTALAPDKMAAASDADTYGLMTLGQVAGSIGGASALGKLGTETFGRVAPSLLGGAGKAQFARNLATDAAYGGLYGGITQGDPLSGAALGAVGSAGGQGVSKGLGAAVGGVATSPASQRLADAGVFQTVGQKLGGIPRSIENALTSVPGIGDLVARRYREGFGDFNRAAFREAGAPIGATVNNIGEQGVQQLLGQAGQAYDSATSGVRVALDPEFFSDLARAERAGARLPEDLGLRFRRAMDNRVSPIADGRPARPSIGLEQDGEKLNIMHGGKRAGFFVMQPDLEGGRLPFVGISGVDPNLRGRGIGTAAYEELGRQVPGLMPSPLGLSDAATRIWQRRIGDMPRAEADALLTRARDLGYNIDNPAEVDTRLAPLWEAIGNPRPPKFAEMTGEQYQQAFRGLKGYRSETTNPGFEQDYRDALTLGMDALTGQMQRGGGQRVVKGLQNADQAYRGAKTVQRAVTAARNGSRSGEAQTFTPSQLNDAANQAANKFGGGRQFAQLIDDGQAVLPSVVPDSGTGRRVATMMLPALVGGGAGAGYGYLSDDGIGGGALKGLALASLLAAGGTRGGQKALNAALFARGPRAEMLGRAIRNRAGLFGAAALPLALEAGL